MTSNAGIRLQEERKRLKLTQTELSDIGGIFKNTQLNYEKGIRFPDVVYLEKIAGAGVDIQYVVSGIPSVVFMSPEEGELLSLFRETSSVVKIAIMAALRASVAEERQ